MPEFDEWVGFAERYLACKGLPEDRRAKTVKSYEGGLALAKRMGSLSATDRQLLFDTWKRGVVVMRAAAQACPGARS